MPTVNLARGISKASTQPIILSEAHATVSLKGTCVHSSAAAYSMDCQAGSVQVEFRSLAARTIANE